MKLTDFLSDVGRPIAYYPSLRKITGSTTATILLCQFIYWRGKESDPNGWLYKTSDEIEEETGLSYNEQKTARANLVSAELIEEHYARLDHQMKFRVNLDMINLLWGTEQTVIPESDNPSFGKAIIHDSLNESEITTETTTKDIVSLSKRQLANTSIQAAIFGGMPITEEMMIEARLKDEAPKMFEAALGFSRPLAWTSDKDWTAFEAWVLGIYRTDPKAFERFETWRNTPYVKGSISNNRIRGFVNEFYDAWDMFKKQDAPQNSAPVPVTYNSEGMPESW